MVPDKRVFLLSPANCAGKRAGYLMRREATFPLALRLRSARGAAIGEIFSFMSGLYFRGKLAYATAFSNPPEGCPGILVIVPGAGLLPHDSPIGIARLRRIAGVTVDQDNPRFTAPLRRDAGLLAGRLDPGVSAVLLGSVATAKYLGPLGAILGGRLRYPREFEGMGDMSRGSLMLRCAAAGTELTYVPANGPVRGAGRRRVTA